MLSTIGCRARIFGHSRWSRADCRRRPPNPWRRRPETRDNSRRRGGPPDRRECSAPSDAALEFLAIAGGAARIAEEDRPTLGGVDLKLVITVAAVVARRTAVNAQHHRMPRSNFWP